MLTDYIQKAVDIDADRIEIEYKDGMRWITACRDCIGIGIASLDAEASEALFQEMRELRKKKKVTISGAAYRLSFSKYESFGEWTYVIGIEKARDRTSRPGLKGRV